MTPPRPLDGVRVVSLAQNVPGPLAVARLVGEGASATKVEPPGGDPLAAMCPSWYDELHDAVRVVPLDLKSPAGRDQLDTLLAGADVLVTSQRPSALARLGLDVPALRAAHPHLRHVTIVGDTSRPDVPGHDLTYQATAGLIGRETPATLLADLAGAERAHAAVLLVLREPLGSAREVGLADSASAWAAPRRHGLTRPGGLLGGGLPAYGIYDARDGRVAVAALEPHFRRRLYSALALPLDAPLTDVLRQRTCAEWEAFARAHDLPLAVVR